MTRKKIVLLVLGIVCLPFLINMVAGFMDKNKSFEKSYKKSQKLYNDKKAKNNIARSLDAIRDPFIAEYPDAVTSVCTLLFKSDDPKDIDNCRTQMAQDVGTRWRALGKVAFDLGEPVKARDYFSASIGEGNAFSHFDLVFSQLKDPKDGWQAPQVVRLVQAGAAAGDPRAQYMNSLLELIKVQAPDTDMAQAIRDLFEPIKTIPTVGDSYYELSKLVNSGQIQSDLSYEEILTRADHYGNINASLQMLDYLTMQEGRQQDYKSWVLKAAQYGHPKAQYNLAMIYATSLESKEAQESSLFWLQKAAGNGLTEAKTALGVLLMYGNALIEPNVDAGMQLLEVAAKEGDSNAMFNLGVILMSKNPKHLQTARDHLAQSAKLGHKEAAALLKQLDEQG